MKPSWQSNFGLWRFIAAVLFVIAALGAGLPTPPLARPKVSRMRYAIALFVAVLIFMGGAGYCREVTESFRMEFEDWVRSKKAAGRLPQSSNPARAPIGEVRYELSPRWGYWKMRIDLVDTLYRWRLIEAILLCGGSLAFAHWLMLKFANQESQP